MDKELKDSLAEMQKGLENKSKEQLDNEIKAFEVKYDEIIDTKAKGLIGEELKTFKSTLEDEYKAAIKEVQDHANKLDVKMKTINVVKKGSEDEIKNLITKNFEGISKVRKGNSIKLETKATMTLGVNLSGDQPRDYSMVVAMAPSQMLNFSDLVQGVNITGGSYTFPRETAITGAPGTSAEDALKNEVTYTLTMVDANTDFIAGVTPYSKKMANNLPFLESYLPTALRRDYWKAENGAFDVLLAAAATVSLEKIATTPVKVEMIVNDIAVLEGIDYAPNAIVVRPSDFWDIMKMEKSTGSGYGLPVFVTFENGQLRINGIPVFKANWIGADKYYVGDFTRIKKIITEGLSFEVSTEDQDNFSKNNITARVESQVTIAIERPDSVIIGDFVAV